MKIGIKYCGGCNSSYDRRNMVERLKKEYNHSFDIADEKDIYDLILVLCGCTSGCASHQHLSSRYGRLIVRSENDYNKIIELINNTSNQIKAS